jgi:hypothetical protein
MKKILSCAILAASLLLISGCSTGTPATDNTTPPAGTTTTYDCLKVAGTSATANGSTGIATQFTISPITSFTGGDYTLSFDIYIPSTAATLSFIQIQMPNSSYAPCYFNKYGLGTDAWETVSIPMTTANVAYGALLSDSNAFRVIGNTASDGLATEFYLKNITVTNGTNAALSIPVTAASNYSSNYAPLGTGVTVTTTKK